MPLDSLVPVLVVVDTGNLRGQCHDLLGERRFPTVDGIRRGPAAFGFDVLHVYAAATVDRQPGGVTAALEQPLAATDRFAAAFDAHDRGTVLRHRTGVEGTWSGRASTPVSPYPAGVDLGRRRHVIAVSSVLP